MQFAIVGLGRMGANMARRLKRGGVDLAAYNRSFDTAQELESETGIKACETLPQLVKQLSSPRIVWLMLPAGDATEQALDQLAGLLAKGDVIVNGANAFYKDSISHAAQLAEKGIGFVDAGVSGGVWGLENGYALMVGGDNAVVKLVQPYLEILAPRQRSRLVALWPGGLRPLRQNDS